MNLRPLHKRAVIRREEQTRADGLIVVKNPLVIMPESVDFGRVENAGDRDDIASGDRVVFTTLHATEIPGDKGAFVVPEDSVFAVIV